MISTVLIDEKADRTKYFHYMWDPLPSDGSVKCQSPHVQTTIGYVQGGMQYRFMHAFVFC